MEFPQDVLGLISQFAKPRMRFVHEYNQAMRALGESEWPDVKKRLCDKDAEQVLAALITYTESVLKTQETQTILGLDPRNYHYQSELAIQVMRRDTCDRALRVLLVGEEKVFRYERWLAYDTRFRECDSDSD